MKHIFNPRSTNGGGKTTIVRTLMNKMTHVKDYKTINGVDTHIYVTPSGNPVSIIGSYPKDSVTGGVDRVKNVRDVVLAVAEVSIYADVIMEGLIMSGLQQLTKDIADSSPSAVFHVRELDTSLEQCIANTLKRRAAAGNDKPFDPSKSLAPKHRAVHLATVKLASWGMDAKKVSQRDCYQEICEVLGIPYSEGDI